MFLNSVFSGALSALLVEYIKPVWRRYAQRLRSSIKRQKPLKCSRPSPWLAGRTRRWHTHPVLSSTDDRVDGHGARVAVLVLTLLPFARAEMLIAAITHDFGEYATGDMSGPAKARHPELYAVISDLERSALFDLGFAQPKLNETEVRLLKLCDLLDAYLWALHHHPQMVRRHRAWRAQRYRISVEALALGIDQGVKKIIEGVADANG